MVEFIMKSIEESIEELKNNNEIENVPILKLKDANDQSAKRILQLERQIEN